MQDIYKNIEKHNLDSEPYVFIVFDDADVLSNKKLHHIVIGLFIRSRRLNMLNMSNMLNISKDVKLYAFLLL